MTNKNAWHIKIWDEGKYLDFWSINHVLGGGVLAGISIYTGIHFLMGFIFSLSVLEYWVFLSHII